MESNVNFSAIGEVSYGFCCRASTGGSLAQAFSRKENLTEYDGYVLKLNPDMVYHLVRLTYNFLMVAYSWKRFTVKRVQFLISLHIERLS